MPDSIGFEEHTLDTLRVRLGFPTKASVRGRLYRAGDSVQRLYRERGNGPTWYRVSVAWIEQQQAKPARTDASEPPADRFDVLAEKDRLIAELQAALTHERQTNAWLRGQLDRLRQGGG
jgi:hypothetical protein